VLTCLRVIKSVSVRGKFSEIIGPMRAPRSTTLYITCIAGCQYNFIHITRILFNFANDIGVPNWGPKSGSKSGSQIGVPNQGPKSGSQIGVLNWGLKSGSQMGVSQIEVQIRVQNGGPKSGSQIGVLNRGLKSESQIGVSQIEDQIRGLILKTTEYH
jgi:hypothetical protein